MLAFRPLAVLAVAAFLSAAPDVARATTNVTTTLERGDQLTRPGYAIAIAGGPADDAITVTLTATAITIEDLGDALAVTGPCSAVDDHHARCDGGALSQLGVNGGDGDDAIAVVAGGYHDGSVRLAGGPGADRITGGPNGDALDGGPGADVIDGGAGDDVIGIAEADLGAPDRIDGGDDHISGDWVEIRDGSAMVVADLAAGTITGGTTLTRIENLRGVRTTTGLRLVGDDGPNHLEGATDQDGRGGDDQLIGTPGPGTLTAGAGQDRLSAASGNRLDGGAGDDVLFGPDDGVLVTATCGPGHDQLNTPAGATAPADCETTVVPGVADLSSARLGRAAIAVHVFPSRDLEACGWVVSATAGDRLVGRSVRSGLGHARIAALRLPLTRAGRLLRPGRTITLRVRAARRCPAHRAWRLAPSTLTQRMELARGIPRSVAPARTVQAMPPTVLTA